MLGCCHMPVWNNRCTGCGHRQAVNGVEPKATRWQPPWTWPGELIGRRKARRAGTGFPAERGESV